jgi:outer membrane lipoprotein LolB
MNLHVLLRGPLFMAALLISACTTTPSRPVVDEAVHGQHLASLKTLQAFDLKGRIGVQTQKQGFSGSFTWNHQPATDQIALFSPLGSQVATIEKEPTGVTLVTSDHKILRAQDAETLTEQNLGWRLPLEGLHDWVVGRPTPASLDAAWDEKGHLMRLKQDGWDIEYSQYQRVGHYDLPHKIYMKSLQLNLKLIVERWNIDGTDSLQTEQ